ncbi:MAG: NAD(P)H-binding protein [Ferruginibacter sp.]
MTIFIFGATGGTGYDVLTKLLEEKHHVIVLARNPAVLDKIKNEYNSLTIIQGSIYDIEIYQEELNKCDVVISTLGTGTARKPTDIYSKGGQQIIAAMRRSGIKRLITLTAAAFDPTDPGNKNFIVKRIVQPLFKNIYADMQMWEAILEQCIDMDWTIIRPSRLVNGNEKGNYRIQQNHSPDGGGKIGRKDLADFIIKQINSRRYIHQKVAIAY